MSRGLLGINFSWIFPCSRICLDLEVRHDSLLKQNPSDTSRILSMFLILRQFDASLQGGLSVDVSSIARDFPKGLLPESHSRVSGIVGKIILEFAS